MALHDGAESVDGVSGVLDGTHCAVGLHQAVAALHVPAAALLLSTDVRGDEVVNPVPRVGSYCRPNTAVCGWGARGSARCYQLLGHCVLMLHSKHLDTPTVHVNLHRRTNEQIS
jgi:hypothetical protein